MQYIPLIFENERVSEGILINLFPLNRTLLSVLEFSYLS